MPRPTDADVLAALATALAEAAAAPDLEAALTPLTSVAYTLLGDPEAAARPGMLKESERDYRIAGVFLISPDRRYNMLVANRNFPTEQRRLSVPIEWNHPGEVVRTEAPILLRNTDEEEKFRQFLKTSKMGSTIYFPIHAGPQKNMVGQIVAASQARTTYDETDLARLGLLAAAAALVWEAKDGPAWLAADYPAPDIWRAEENAV
ncbi:MAG: GAF domain-containing protein [Pseudomonadota bacterium]